MGPDFENPLEINFVFSDAAMTQFKINGWKLMVEFQNIAFRWTYIIFYNFAAVFH